ncbi:MAG: hypothetical protein AAGA03_11125 [Planctomycetota bacterium]
MAQCPTCGAGRSSVIKALMMCILILFAGVGLLTTGVFGCLVLISAVGTSSNERFNEVAAELSAQQTDYSTDVVLQNEPPPAS